MYEWSKIEYIHSRHNQLYKACLQLGQESKARQAGRVLCEGLRLCQTAALKGNEQLWLFAADERGENCWRKLAGDIGSAKCLRLESTLFDRLAQTNESQGVLLTSAVPPLKCLSVQQPTWQKLLVALEDIADPGNMGTMLRTLEALGIEQVVLLGNSVWPYNQKALRASMGSVFFLDLWQAESVQELRRQCHTHALLCADSQGQPLQDYLKTSGCKYPEIILLLGNEAHGISSLARELATQCLAVEMTGKAESLNVAAALAILSYNLRQMIKSDN